MTSLTPFDEKLSWIETHFIEIKNSPEVFLDLKYATSENFMQENVYQGFSRCFLAPMAADMFFQACEKLKSSHPHLQFRIWDALRPRQVQARFFEHLQGTPFENYVAPPNPGSLHNYGMALDLTLQTKSAELLDMGTDFDDFKDLAQPRLEKKFLKEGRLTQAQWLNRQLLRDLLESVGFLVLPHEWWHFNALPAHQVHGHKPSLD
jgi:D-alanyl-D-alanine dipeptidase